MIRFSVLGSGKYNSVYVEVDGIAILLDCGFSYKQMVNRLGMINKKPADIAHIFVTHFHGDHVAGLELFCETNEIGYSHSEDAPMFGVTVIPLSHDDPSFGYVIKDNSGNKLAYITDTGHLDIDIIRKLKHVNAIILEFNYNIDMLISGDYHQELKDRILSPTGHLSNEQSGDLLRLIDWMGLEIVVPCHLSLKNNNAELVMYEAKKNVGDNCTVVISKHTEPTKMFTLI